MLLGTSGYTFGLKRDDGVEIEVHIPNEHATWPELLEEFRHFLLGCGFCIKEEDWNV
jgi:hypothetical protein